MELVFSSLNAAKAEYAKSKLEAKAGEARCGMRDKVDTGTEGSKVQTAGEASVKVEGDDGQANAEEDVGNEAALDAMEIDTPITMYRISF